MNILEIGIQHGMERGERQKLTELVQKKLAKGYSVSEIAEMLEESEETIREIINEANLPKS